MSGQERRRRGQHKKQERNFILFVIGLTVLISSSLFLGIKTTKTPLFSLNPDISVPVVADSSFVSKTTATTNTTDASTATTKTSTARPMVVNPEYETGPDLKTLIDDTLGTIDQRMQQTIFSKYPKLRNLDQLNFTTNESGHLKCQYDLYDDFQRKFPRYNNLQRNQLSTIDETKNEECNLPEVLYNSIQLYNLTYPTHTTPSKLEDCRFFSFNRHETCSLLKMRPKLTLLFIGSSVIRHLVQAFGIVLTGNYMTGATKYIAKIETQSDLVLANTWKRMCACQNYPGCSKPIMTWNGVWDHQFTYDSTSYKNFDNLCVDSMDDGTPAYQILYIKEYSDPLSTQLKQKMVDVASNLRQNHRSVIVISDATALAGGLNVTKTKQFWNNLHLTLGPSVPIIMQIPITVHYVGRNKAVKWLATQGPERVEDYNKKLKEWVHHQQTHPIQYHSEPTSQDATATTKTLPLYTYNLTSTMHSKDGTHYKGVSIACVQFILNYVAWKFP